MQVDRSGRADGHPSQGLKVAFACTAATVGPQYHAIAVSHDHLVGGRVGDEEPARAIHGNGLQVGMPHYCKFADDLAVFTDSDPS